MITGRVSNEGVPIIQLAVAGKTWSAVIDTGFNGDLELPVPCAPFLTPGTFTEHARCWEVGRLSMRTPMALTFHWTGSLLSRKPPLFQIANSS